MTTNENIDPRDQIKLTNLENLYQIKDEKGQIIDYEKANGRQLFNHYRHNMTNYDEILDEIRTKQGHVKGYQQKKAVIGAAEQVLAKYHEEHVKVVQDSQIKGNILKKLLEKAKVKTASQLVELLDNWSEKIKEIGNLKSSQRSLQTWNDTYRVQIELVKKLLKEEDISPEIAEKITAIYKTKSVNKAIEKGCDIFYLEKSEVLKIVKKAIRYSKLVQKD
jgi:DNA repair ATPase RecN